MNLKTTKSGFTLMEILAVLLVLAVIVSAAAPVFRSVRYEIRNAQAKSALRKVAEAARSFYSESRGNGELFGGSFVAGNVATFSNQSCSGTMATGIPPQSTGSNAGDGSSGANSAVANLFACGFLLPKDFNGMPYTFKICNPASSGGNSLCDKLHSSGLKEAHRAYAMAWGNDDVAGEKFLRTGLDVNDGYLMYVGADMNVYDTYDNEQ